MMPDAYKTGFKRFYGRDFFVNKNVLIPRIETEGLIDIVKKLASSRWPSGRICDVGTGSGCIGITLKLEMPSLDVALIDISKAALKVANINAKRLKANVKIIEHDLLDKPYDIVVANLPYVPHDRINKLDPGVKNYEPLLALDGGRRGLEIIYRLLESPMIHASRYVLLEIDDTHTKKDFERFGQVNIIKDKFKRNRFVIITPCTK